MHNRRLAALADPRYLAIPAFLGSVALEAWHQRGERAEAQGVIGYEATDTAASMTMGVGNLVINAALAGAMHRFDERVRHHRIVDIGTGPLAWLTAMVAWDFLYYCEHRMSHEVRLFWGNHVTHHSSEHYNLSTALRQPWSGYLAHWVYAPLPFVGARPIMVQTVQGLNLLYQYWIHTEAIGTLPAWFERVFNTPSHHRVHHGSDPQYLDRNYAGIFIVWDRLLGSFEPEDEPVTYGLTTNISTRNPLRIAYHEMVDIACDVVRAPSWRERFHRVFGPPGQTPLPPRSASAAVAGAAA